MLIGYARVSTGEQNPDLQHRALKAAGCGEVFEDRVSGAAVKRPGLEGALAEFERSLIQERTCAGMHAARARGARVGRKPALSPSQVAHARKLVENGESPAAVARSLKVGRATLYRALKDS